MAILVTGSRQAHCHLSPSHTGRKTDEKRDTHQVALGPDSMA